MSKRFKLDISDGNISVAEKMDVEESAEVDEEKRKNRLRGEVIETCDKKLCFVPENRYEEFNDFLAKLFEETTTMNLTGTVLCLLQKLMILEKNLSP